MGDWRDQARRCLATADAIEAETFCKGNVILLRDALRGWGGYPIG